ncbi:gp53-like domain-containing protein [Sphingomonas sp. Leaf257]|uniref:gp53-like domain-containing protein n=1 Tax=Sphingomonas sp. Leaf257 TaxID=1736309 RepID=UPI001443BA42|nr:DUF1983 domain-containing protein [Sphingomonas sp. Leaf257]
MAKALKIAGAVVAVAGLAIVTGGLAAGASLSFIMSASFGVGSLTVGGLIAASAVLNTAGSLLSPKPKAPATSEANANRLTVSMDVRAFRKTVVGSTAMATDLRDQEWSADQSILHRFIVCASHRCQAIREIWFDDKLAWSATGGVQAPYVGYLDVTPVLEGSAANAINIGARMGNTRRYTGLAYVYLRFKLTGNGKKAESPFASSIPSRVTIVGDGALFYDPRLDSTVPGGSGPMRADDQRTWAWSASACRNPALGLLFFLLGWRIQNPATGEWKLAVGKGIPASRIDLPSFITAANLCDEPVTRADGTTEARYRSDGIYSEGDDPGLVLDNYKAAMNAVLDDADGKIRVTVLHNDLATPIGDLSTSDVMGEFTWLQTPPLTDSVNIIRGGYTDPSANSLYQLVDLPEVKIASPDGIDRPQTVNLALVQSPGQGQRLFKLRLGRAQYGGTFTAVFQATAWKYQKGDVIRFSFLPLGWDKKLFRIADMATQVDGTVPMMLREEHPDIYLAYSNEAAAIKAAAPTTYDPTLWPVQQAIADAGKTAEWSNVSGTEGVVTAIKSAGDKADAITKNLVGDKLSNLLRTPLDEQAAFNIDFGAAAISAASALAKQNLVAIQTFGTRIEDDGSKVAESFEQLTSRLDEAEKKVAGIDVKGEVAAGMTQLRRTIANANYASFEAVDNRIATYGEGVTAWQIKEEKARVEANKAVYKSVDEVGLRVVQEGLDRAGAIKDLRNMLIDENGNLVVERIQGLGTRVTVMLNGKPVTLESAIQTVDTSYKTDVGTVAKSVKTLAARMDDVGGATIEQSFKTVADKVTGLSAEYTLKVQTDRNGRKRVAGMGIASENGVSAIVLTTDTLSIETPDGGDKPLLRADIGGVYMPNVRVDHLSAGAIDFEFLSRQSLRDPAGGYQALPGGFYMMWGQYRQYINSETSLSIVFPIAFPTMCMSFVATPYINSASDVRDLWLQNMGAPSRFGASVYTQAPNVTRQTLDGFDWFAVGY